MTKTRQRIQWPRIPRPRPSDPGAAPPSGEAPLADEAAPDPLGQEPPHAARQGVSPEPVTAGAEEVLRRIAAALGNVLTWLALALINVLTWLAVAAGKALAWLALGVANVLIWLAVGLGKAVAWLAVMLWRFLRWAGPVLGPLLPPLAAVLRRALARGAAGLGRALRWLAIVLWRFLRRGAILLGASLARGAVLLWVALAQARAARAIPQLVTVSPTSPWWLQDPWLRGPTRPSGPAHGGAVAAGPQANGRGAGPRAPRARAGRGRKAAQPVPRQRALRAAASPMTAGPDLQPLIAAAETTQPMRALPEPAPPRSAWPEITQPLQAMPPATEPLPTVPPANQPRPNVPPATKPRPGAPSAATRVRADSPQPSYPAGGTGRTGWRPAARIAAALVWAAVGVVLFLCYLRVSRTAGVDSDGASNVLQAWDMLHGNPLLRGWRLSDVSFYTTELPEYMLVELVRGISPDVVHIAGALTYTLLVLLTALLAQGRAAARTGLLRAAIAGGIMLAPQLGNGVYVLLLAPDHVGSTVPVMLVWLLLDRARPRWYVPVAAGVLLTWGLVADNIVLITGVLPLTVTCAIRVCRSSVAGRRPLWASWFELALITAAVVATQLARTVLMQITAHGGFTVAPVDTRLAEYPAMPQHVLLAAHGLLLLFGADFFGHSLGLVSALAMLHAVGLVLAGAATCSVLRRFAAGRDLVAQVLGAGVVISLGAYLISHQVADLHSTREVAAVLPFSAALAGRVFGPRLERARMKPAVALLLAGYLASLVRVMTLPPAPAQNQRLATWLSAHGLDNGLAGYWQASSTTVASGDRVQLRPVGATSDGIRAFNWETDRSWFDPAAHDVNFITLYPSRPGSAPYPWVTDVRAAFGQPARIYYVDGYTVMVWNSNLLTELSRSAP